MSEPDFNDRWRAGEVTDIEDGTEPVNQPPDLADASGVTDETRAAFPPPPWPEWLARARDPDPGPVDLAEFIDDEFARMQRRAQKLERPVTTPWPSLNDATWGGLWPGFYILASGTGVGKTQLLLQLALHAAEEENERRIERARVGVEVERRPVVYVGLELGRLDIAARMLSLASIGQGSNASRVPWSKLVSGKAEPADFGQIDARGARERLKQANIMAEVAPPKAWGSPRQLQRIIDMRPRMVVIDFLQLVAKDVREDLREAMGRVAYQLRAMARDHDAVVLAISSTARANYAALASDPKEVPPGQGDPGRFVGIGKESGDLEFSADGVFALLQGPKPEHAPGLQRPPREAWLAIAKARSSYDGAGWVKLAFDGTTFDDDNAGAGPDDDTRACAAQEMSNAEREVTDAAKGYAHAVSNGNVNGGYHGPPI